jgi:hypothetical protein
MQCLAQDIHHLCLKLALQRPDSKKNLLFFIKYELYAPPMLVLSDLSPAAHAEKLMNS